VAGRADEEIKVLGAVDGAVAKGARLSDPTLIGSIFLHRFFREYADLVRGGRKLDNVEMLLRLAAMLEPASASLRLANQTMHLMSQGLFTLTKMQRPPERGRQVLKLVRHDYFEVAWGLFRLAAAVGLVADDAFQGWSTAVRRVERGGEIRDRGRRRPRRRRHPRRRRR
jgi:hypothetical protein